MRIAMNHIGGNEDRKGVPMMPSLFLSHGAPTLALDPVPARDFLVGLGQTVGRPRAIVVASAHWETDVPTVNAVTVNDTIHDFGGFPQALYTLAYHAPGSTELAAQVVDLLGVAGIACRQDPHRGLDHGAWVPLLLAWPQHDIPVIQLSVQPRLGPGHHYQVGLALEALGQEDVLVIGSGSFTHNLRELAWHGEAAAEPTWSREFADWFDAALVAGRTCDLMSYRTLAPHAARNHPTDEHLLPIFVALGAGGRDAAARRLHSSTTYGALRMDAYVFS